MSRRLILFLTAIVLLLVAAAYAGSPFLAVRGFVAAARSGDAGQLNDAIDFPAVREGLKSQAVAAIDGRLDGDHRTRHSPFGGLGKLLAPLVADQTIDALVTPDAIAGLVRRGDVRASGSGGPPARPLRYSNAYVDPDHFRTTLVSPDRPDSPAGLIFERRSLFWWKLVRLDLPKDIMAGRERGAPKLSRILAKAGI